MVDILVFLFESYMQSSQEQPSFDVLTQELEDAGFDQADIVKAFTWLEGLSHYEQSSERLEASTKLGTRHFTHHEQRKLGLEGIEFLRYLDQNQLTTELVREMIIDRTMAVDRSRIEIEQLKWISLIILCYKNPENRQMKWYENFIFEDQCYKTLH